MVFKFTDAEKLMDALRYLYKKKFLGNGFCEWTLDMLDSLIGSDCHGFKGARKYLAASKKLRGRIYDFMVDYPSGNAKKDDERIRQFEDQGWKAIGELCSANLPMYIEVFSFGDDLHSRTEYTLFPEAHVEDVKQFRRFVKNHQ